MSPRAILTLSGAVTAAILVLGVDWQLYDATYYALTNAQSILAGDRILIDFFDPGIPLDAYTAAAVQWLTGHRLIGEIVRQWAGVIAGVLLAVYLGIRRAGGATALFGVPLVLLMTAHIGLYHWSKVLMIPLFVLVGWRFIERPDAGRAAVVAMVTVIAFLFRHDYGVYLGAGSIMVFACAHLGPRVRRGRPLVQVGVYAVTTVVLLAPWLWVVQSREGLVEFVRVRSELWQGSPASTTGALFASNPLADLLPMALPPPKAGTVMFRWASDLPDADRQRAEQTFHLQDAGRDEGGRRRYVVPNIYEPRLLELDHLINDPGGFELDAIRRAGRPNPEWLRRFLARVALVVPFVLLAMAVRVWRRERMVGVDRTETRNLVFAAMFLELVTVLFLREWSYVTVVAPTAFMLGATAFGAGRWPRAAAIVVMAPMLYAAGMSLAFTSWVAPGEWIPRLGHAATLLMADARTGEQARVHGQVTAYLEACTEPTDRVLFAGMTPLDISYASNRAAAGGHINWHLHWRNDPRHEAESLALLQRQRPPVLRGFNPPLMEDLAAYPAIRAWVLDHYRLLDGTEGILWVDTSRAVAGVFGDRQWPCFREPRPASLR